MTALPAIDSTKPVRRTSISCTPAVAARARRLVRALLITEGRQLAVGQVLDRALELLERELIGKGIDIPDVAALRTGPRG